ncbi:MAG: hypothetical protein ACKO7R_19065 [Pseudanabaena sp.]
MNIRNAKKSTWIALGASFTMFAATGIALAVTKAKSAVWLLLVESIVMISISPLVGDWLNGLKKQRRLEGFWKKFLVVLLVTGINAILATLAVHQMAIAYDHKSLSLQNLFIIGSLAWSVAWSVAGAWVWIWAWAWAMAWAVAVAGAVAGTGAVVGSVVVAGSVAASVAVAVAVAVAWASEDLIESVGKWKATMILFATGLTALGVGLLVKVLFGG